MVRRDYIYWVRNLLFMYEKVYPLVNIFLFNYIIVHSNLPEIRDMGNPESYGRVSSDTVLVNMLLVALASPPWRIGIVTSRVKRSRRGRSRRRKRRRMTLSL